MIFWRPQSRRGAFHAHSPTVRGLLTLLTFINPAYDPSFTVAVILTFIEELGSGDSPVRWVLMLFLNVVAVKAVVWVVVNFVFAAAFLARKGWWAAQNPKLAWRVLDALGTGDIMVGPIREVVQQTTGSDASIAAMIGALAEAGQQHLGAGRPPRHMLMAAAQTFEAESLTAESLYQHEHLRQVLQEVLTLLSDWLTTTESKWTMISDSQLGWKSLQGRWNSWTEIYRESFAEHTSDPVASQAVEQASTTTDRRFSYARDRGSAASAVACFLRDTMTLHEAVALLDLPEDLRADLLRKTGALGVASGMSGLASSRPDSLRMFVDADD